MKNLFLTLILLLCIPALALGQSGKANRNLERLQFDANDYLRTNVSAGSASATEYTEGDVDTTITGPAIMWEDAGNVLAPVSVAKPLPVDGSGVTQPISATSLPLPSGAATSALQLPDGHNVTVDNASIAVTGTFYQGTQPISAAALPLPSGAATSALQLADGHNVTVDNASIPVTGTFYQGTQPISAAALPLPSGAATSALQLPDGHNVTVDNASIAVTGTFYQGTQPVSGTFWQGTQPVSGTVTAALSATADITMQLEDADVAEANPLPVRLSDGTSFVDPAVLGTTAYSEGTTKASVIGYVRNDVLEALVDTDNEVAPGQVNADGAIYTTGGDHYGVLELGVTELIGINEIVSATKLSDEVAVVFSGTGEIRKVCMFTDEQGATGTVYSPSGTLYLFDADPTVTLNDAAFAADEHNTIHAMFTFDSGGWVADTLGSSNCQDTKEVYSNGTMWAVWRLGTGETEVNTTDTDDEVTEVNFWYLRKT